MSQKQPAQSAGIERLIKAVAGETINITIWCTPESGRGAMDRRKTDVVVKEACALNNGQWCCVTHDKFFDNQFQKDSHTHDEEGTHKLAWNCVAHGIEAP